MNRRGFLRLGLGAAAAIAAPALVSRANIMAVRPLRDDTITGLQLLMDWQRRYDELLRMEIGQIDRFTVYVDHALHPDTAAIVKRWNDGAIEVADLTASNYGRGPGLLTEDALGVRHWRPEPTAEIIRRRMQQGERQLRQLLEPHRSRRWV